MKIAIVVSKGLENKVGRIYTQSQIAEVLEFLRLLGIDRWQLDTKGDVRLYFNGEVYVGIGPANGLEKESFLLQAEGVMGRRMWTNDEDEVSR